MISWFSKTNERKKGNIIDYPNLKNNIDKLKLYNKSDDVFDYVINLFDEYDLFLRDNYKSAKLVFDNLKNTLGDYLKDCLSNIKMIEGSNIVLSPSHDNTYYLLKELNKEKDKKVLVVCFDMHSDTYDYNDRLWKGNVFSKLIKEQYIENLVILGIDNFRINKIKSDIQLDIRPKVKIITLDDLEKILKESQPTNIFISIDIDCLNTREAKITALEYCPMTVLENISKLEIKNCDHDKIEQEILDSVFVKNNLGYANLYHVGENDFNIQNLFTSIDTIKELCKNNNFKLGLSYNNNNIIADITEIDGIDYGGLTTVLVVKLIEKLKEVNDDEK